MLLVISSIAGQLKKLCQQHAHEIVDQGQQLAQQAAQQANLPMISENIAKHVTKVAGQNADKWAKASAVLGGIAFGAEVYEKGSAIYREMKKDREQNADSVEEDLDFADNYQEIKESSYSNYSESDDFYDWSDIF